MKMVWKLFPYISIKYLGEQVSLSKSRVAAIISDLKTMGKIRRMGGNRGGYWEVVH